VLHFEGRISAESIGEQIVAKIFGHESGMRETGETAYNKVKRYSYPCTGRGSP
jgi:hypothetical protein